MVDIVNLKRITPSFDDDNPNIAANITEFSHNYFEISVICIKISGCGVSSSLCPTELDVIFPPRADSCQVEFNDNSIPSEKPFFARLKRDRYDFPSGEVFYVGTMKLRATNSLSFQVMQENDCILTGILKKQRFLGQSQSYEDVPSTAWIIDCQQTERSPHCIFNRKRPVMIPEMLLPCADISIMGSFRRTPRVLARNVIFARRRTPARPQMEAIQDFEQVSSSSETSNSSMVVERDVVAPRDAPVDRIGDYEMDLNEFYGYSPSEYFKDNFDWLRTGLKVGAGVCVGIVLGMTLFSRCKKYVK